MFCSASYRVAFLLLAVMPLINGCVRGPRALRLSRSQFNQAILETDQEAMLLNLVRLKYHEPIEFLEVGGVAQQYSFTRDGGLSATIPEAGLSTLGLSLNATTTERPTLTYLPQHGEEFNQRLLSPISIDTVSLLSFTGWPIDKVMRLTVQSVNDVYNVPTAGGQIYPWRPQFEEFVILSSALRQLQLRNQLEIVYATHEPTPASPPVPRSQLLGSDLIAAAEAGYTFRPLPGGRDEHLWQLYAPGQAGLVMRIDPQAIASPEMMTLVKLAKLREPRPLYEIESGAEGQLKHRPANRAHARETLTIGRRTFLELMYFLSYAVEVPAEHMEQGLVVPVQDYDGSLFDWRQVTGDLLQIHVAKGHAPADAAVAVPYKGYWFYIAGNDLSSKSTFALLIEIYGIEIRGGGGTSVPVLTLGL